MPTSSKTQSLALPIGFFLIVLILLMLAGYTLSRFSDSVAQFREVVEVYQSRVQMAHQMRSTSRERAPKLFAIIQQKDPFERFELIEEFRELGAQFLDYREQLIATGLDSDELALLENHREIARTNAPEQRRVIELVEEERNQEAMNFLVERVSPRQLVAMAHLDEFIALTNAKAKEAVAHAEQEYQDTMRTSIILTLFGASLSFAIGALVSVRLRSYVRALRSANEELEDRVLERTRELTEANQRLSDLATHDGLTGLPNRSAFEEQLENYLNLSRRNSHMLGIMFIDLDGFKAVNDTLGHDYGDELLQQVAERLRSTLRNEDLVARPGTHQDKNTEANVVARIGGDEFTIALPQIHKPDDSTIAAQRIINALGEPFEIKGEKCHIGCSIGISVYPTHGNEATVLLRLADEAMYQIKQSGKNNFRLCPVN